MQVWVCEHCWDYEGCEVVVVFSTQEAAFAWREHEIAVNNYKPWNVQVTEHEAAATFVPPARAVPGEQA